MGELVLQVNTEVHVLHWMDDNVYELHAGYLETQWQMSQFIWGSLYFVKMSGMKSSAYHEVNVAVVVDEVLH